MRIDTLTYRAVNKCRRVGNQLGDALKNFIRWWSSGPFGPKADETPATRATGRATCAACMFCSRSHGHNALYDRLFSINCK